MDITMQDIDAARERTRAECDAQGLTLEVEDEGALGPLARAMNRAIEQEAAVPSQRAEKRSA